MLVDTHTGGNGRDWIWAGNDYILQDVARGDIIYGGAGADRLEGSGHQDLILGGAGDDTIYGDAGNDWIDGGDGVDTIDGGLGDDVIHGGAGGSLTNRQLVRGGYGNDVIVGGEGNDRLDGGNRWGNNNASDLADGDDLVYGGAGDDRLRGGPGNDTLRGGDGNDFLTASRGDDVLDGGPGNDRLRPTSGDDLLTGGPGNDTFIYDQIRDDYGTDVITDFEKDVDSIDLDSTVTDAQKTTLVNKIAYVGSTGAYTSATINLGDAGVTNLAGVIHVHFDEPSAALDVTDFV